jgi:hypothetical protein
MIPLPRSLMLFSGILLGSLMVGQAQSKEPEVQNLSTLLPSDTPIYLRINEPAKLFLDEFRNPVFLNALKNIPQIGGQLENPQIDQVKMVLGLLSSTEDLSWSEMVRELLAGPAEIALSPYPQKLVMTVKPKDAARLGRLHAKLLEFIQQDAQTKGNPDPVKKFKHGEIDCFSLAPTEAHAIYGGRFVLASSEKILGDALDVLSGAKKLPSTLDKEPRFLDAVKSATPDSRQAFGFARMDLIRKSNPGTYTVADDYNPLLALLFGGWVEAYRQADWLGMAIDWKANKPALEAFLPISAEVAKGELRKAFTPPKGTYAAKPLSVPNQLGTLSLWRDLGKVWNIRENVVTGPALQGLNGLDNGIGQFFGGRDFGTGVLGSLKPDWRVVVAEQDPKTMIPKPDLVLPAFAISVGYDTKDEDFRQRWIIAFQSLIGVLNVVGGQEKAPVLVQNQEDFEGAKIYSAKYLPPVKPANAKPGDSKTDEEGIHIRHNFRPTLVLAGDHLIISSTTEMARDVVKAIKAADTGSDAPPQAMSVDLNGKRIAGMVEVNRERLVMQNMVEKGHGKAAAQSEIGAIEGMIRGLNHAVITAEDTENQFRLKLSLDLNQADKK